MINNVILFLIFMIAQSTSEAGKNRFSEDCVKDEGKALKIAENLWLRTYGESIYKKKPFIAEKRDSIWVVKGTLNSRYGGVPYVEIRIKDCKILKLTHSK